MRLSDVPEIRGWIAENVAREITRTLKDGRAVIRMVVEERLFNRLPKKQAVELIRSVIMLNANQARAVARLAAELEQSGVQPEDIARQGRELSDKLLAARAATIAEFELRRARSAAQEMLWKKWRQEGVIKPNARKLWIALDDPRTCPVCMDLDGEEVGLDELFDGQYAGPPLHVACRCEVMIVGGEARREAAAAPATMERSVQPLVNHIVGEVMAALAARGVEPPKA